MKARVKYNHDYNGKEGYVIYLCVDGEWVFSSFFPLVKREGANDNEESNFVHFSIINKIAELQAYGYVILF